jgi:hypothetical protein
MAKISVFMENSNVSKAKFSIQAKSFVLIFFEINFPEAILPKVE